MAPIIIIFILILAMLQIINFLTGDYLVKKGIMYK